MKANGTSELRAFMQQVQSSVTSSSWPTVVPRSDGCVLCNRPPGRIFKGCSDSDKTILGL